MFFYILDINECDKLGTCDQKCINKYGSYHCDCSAGYKLTAGSVPFIGGFLHKCRALGSNPKLLLSNRATIRQYEMVSYKYYPLINNLESAVALDYWLKNHVILNSSIFFIKFF